MAERAGQRALALDILEPFEKAAYIEQQTGEFRPDGVKRLMHALARGDDGIGKCAGASAAGSRPDDNGLDQFEVVRGIRCARVKSGAQALTGLQLMRLDQGAAVAAAPARQPDQWTFSLVDDDGRAAELGGDLPLQPTQDAARERRRSQAAAAPAQTFAVWMFRRFTRAALDPRRILYRIIYL